MNRKYALCVGVNYPGTSAQLAGCVNDADDWSALLRAAGYSVVRLVDAEATRAGILNQLSNLVATAGYGDRVVFTFSGHGTWVPDIDYDEVDRRDEALCPIDYNTNGTILDDELQRTFAATKYGTGALILSDSCHSGTVSRLVGAPSTPGRPKFIPPHTFLDISQERAVELETKPSRAPRQTTSLISGCADPEYSYDAWFHGRANGAFTRAAIDTYRPGTSLSAWFSAIRTVLPNDGYPQTPQLTPASSYRKYARAL